MQQAIARRRVTAGGEHFTLPLPDGPGKPLVLSLQPVRPRCRSTWPRSARRTSSLTGEIADGWLAIFFDPESGAAHIERIHRAATAAGRDPSAIDISVQATLAMHDDPEQAAMLVRPTAALYIGGMGSKKVNFYHGIATAMGYEREADEVQEKFLARDYTGAAAAVPFEFIDRTSLIGDARPDRRTPRGAGPTGGDDGEHLAGRILTRTAGWKRCGSCTPRPPRPECSRDA